MSAVSVIAPTGDSIAAVTETILQEEVLDVFRQRIVGIFELVKCMPQKDKWKAVEIWNEVSEGLQDLLGELSIRSDADVSEDDIVKPTEADGEVHSEQVIAAGPAADGEETESEAETTEGGDDTRDHRDQRFVAPAIVADQLAEVAAEPEAESKEEVTMTVVQVEQVEQEHKLQAQATVDSTDDTANGSPSAVEVTKIVSDDETESAEPNRTKTEQGESEMTTQAILTENSEGHQVLVELPSSLTLDSDSKIVVNDGDGGLEGIVLTVDTDANFAKVPANAEKPDKARTKEEEWLSHAEKVTVDEYPPMLDEKANRRVNKHEDGSHEVSNFK